MSIAMPILAAVAPGIALRAPSQVPPPPDPHPALTIAVLAIVFVTIAWAVISSIFTLLKASDPTAKPPE